MNGSRTTRNLVAIATILFVLAIVFFWHDANAQVPKDRHGMVVFTDQTEATNPARKMPERKLVILGVGWQFNCALKFEECDKITPVISKAYSNIQKGSAGKYGESTNYHIGTLYCTAVREQCDEARKRLVASGLVKDY